MDTARESAAEEATRLRRYLNDLVSIVVLPALWAGTESQQIANNLLDALMRMLELAFVLIRFNDSKGLATGIVRMGELFKSNDRVPELGMALDAVLGNTPLNWPSQARVTIDGTDLWVASARLGINGEIGMLLAGANRPDFPQQIERLLLDVAANQAALWLQQERRLNEQKRVAVELDERVAQRTRELAAANEQLQRSEAFLVEGQYLSRVGSFAWRMERDEITWSEQLYRIFEFEQGTPVTLERIASRVHPDDIPLLNEMTERARRGVNGFEYEHRLLMADRSIKYLHLIAHRSGDDTGQREYIGAVQDVTQRRLSEEALGTARSELSRVIRVTSLGVLTASIAHEVNQPLSGIITNSSTCLRMLSADPPNVEGARETARRTIRDGNRASDVITRLRTLYSKKETSFESMNLNEVTREVTALSLSELHRSGAVLRYELADDLPPVAGDRIQLQQVIMNLLRNAADAMSTIDDRPRELLIRTERDGDKQVRLSIKDSGVGFGPQAEDKIFEAFYTTKTDGMGIGLSISRSIIEAHQGRLWATQNDGPGATFWFVVPCTAEGLADADTLVNSTDAA